MSDPFLAEIRIFPFAFPPRGWATCDGQLLSISQNTALFSLVGTYYGGDGRTTFALPAMAGNVAIQSGQGPGLSPRGLGETGGSPSVTLTHSEMPAHTHSMMASTAAGTQVNPQGNVPAKPLWVSGTSFGAGQAYSSLAPQQQMAMQALSLSGSSQPHNNLQPFLTLNFCIALQGIFPPRS
jgi:microcystin-dependent protein